MLAVLAPMSLRAQRVARRSAVSALALGVLASWVLASSASAAGAPGDVAATAVADIHPGSSGSSPGQIANVNGTAFFTANDGINGAELWKSDGTAAGTMVIEDSDPFTGGIKPGPPGSLPGNLTNVNGTLFFTANDGSNGVELWMSDGTPAGTTLVEDIIPGADETPNTPDSSSPTWLTNVNGTLYFAADDGTNGVELWRSDGTPAGTTIVADIMPGDVGFPPHPASSSPLLLTNVNGTLFFAAFESTNGYELWKSDGTPAGTTIVPALNQAGGINPGAAGSLPGILTNVNGTLFFSADGGFGGNELWKSDGTAAGTTIVEDSVPGGGLNPGSIGSFPGSLTNVNGTLYFDALVGGGVDAVEERWHPRGNDDGRGLLPFKPDQRQRHPLLLRRRRLQRPRALEERRHPRGDDDGGAALRSEHAGRRDQPRRQLVQPRLASNVNGILFFGADDGTNGYELWRSDRTAAGTKMIEDPVPGGGLRPGAAGSSPTALADVNGTLYFAADDGTNGVELWKATFEGSPPPPTDPPSSQPGSTTGSIGATGLTGQRAAALKKCKKKRGSARRTCKGRARTAASLTPCPLRPLGRLNRRV